MGPPVKRPVLASLAVYSLRTVYVCYSTLMVERISTSIIRNIQYDCNTLLHFFSNLAESLDKGHITPTLIIAKIQGLAFIKIPRMILPWSDWRGWDAVLVVHVPEFVKGRQLLLFRFASCDSCCSCSSMTRQKMGRVGRTWKKQQITCYLKGTLIRCFLN